MIFENETIKSALPQLSIGAYRLGGSDFSGVRLLGIISDTHDNVHMIDEAVNKLNELDVGLVFHAGDYVSPFTVQHFKPLVARMIGVYGNNCAERAALKRLFSDIGVDLRGFFAEVSVGDVKVALLHGHDEELLRSLIGSGVYDLVVYGHTHRAWVEVRGRTTMVNPGEVCGYLSGRSTLAVYDLESGKVETVTLSK